jgi:hypothetical protein
MIILAETNSFNVIVFVIIFLIVLLGFTVSGATDAIKEVAAAIREQTQYYKDEDAKWNRDDDDDEDDFTPKSPDPVLSVKKILERLN